MEIMGWYKVIADEDGNIQYCPLTAEEFEAENERASAEELERYDLLAEREAYDWETRMCW